MWGEVWPAYHIYGYTSRYLDPFSNKMQWMMASMRAAAAGGGGIPFKQIFNRCCRAGLCAPPPQPPGDVVDTWTLWVVDSLE